MASKLQLGYDDERFETIVNRNFHCLICFNVLREPVMCRKNQHYFCRGCITEHLRRNSHTCPTCADELSVETLCDVPRIVKDYLDELSIRCDYYDRGCRELVQLQNLKHHVAECGFTPVVCGNEGCGETISKRDRAYHESELCEFRKLKCRNCGEFSTKMTAMDTKVETMSTKVASTDTRVKNIDTKVGNIHRKVGNIDRKVENINRKVEKLDMKTGDIEKNLADVNRKMANTYMEIGNIKTNLAEVKEKMERIDIRMANPQVDLHGKFEALNNEVREIKMSLTEVKDKFHSLKEAVLDKVESKERNQEEMARVASGTGNRGAEKQYILVAGGYERNSVEIFNYRQRLWSLLKPMPAEQYWRASSFVYNNRVTVAGGFCPDCVDGMIQLNIHPTPNPTIHWTRFAAKLPARLCGHSSVVYEDSLFVTGGYIEDQHIHSDSIHKIQLKPPYTVKLLSTMLQPRTNHSTVLCDDSILIFGGRNADSYKDNLRSVVRYDLKKNKCQQLPQLPYPVSDMVTVKWSENAVIIGGADKDGKALNKVIIYNIKTGNSHMLPPMLHKRRACMAVVIQNTIVVMGGEGFGDPSQSVEGFNFDRYAWEELPNMKDMRIDATAVVI